MRPREPFPLQLARELDELPRRLSPRRLAGPAVQLRAIERLDRELAELQDQDRTRRRALELAPPWR